MNGIPVYLMRGGSSRGVVADASTLPPAGPERNRVILSIIGRETVALNGVGGGSPTTSKFVAIEAVNDFPDRLRIEYAVANLSPGTDIVDWSGTCGNMTATVPLYALEQRLLKIGQKPIELVNRSTFGVIAVDDLRHANSSDHAIEMVTRYLQPAGSIFPELLPTGHPRDSIEIGDREIAYSLIDVTHPYLFLRRKDITQEDRALNEAELALLETIRGEVATRTGMASNAREAATTSPSVPRVVLVSDGSNANEIAVTAVTLGKEISSVPVTCALCIGVAARLPHTVVSEGLSKPLPDRPIIIRSKSFEIEVTTTIGDGGEVLWASVARTARTLMQGVFYL